MSPNDAMFNQVMIADDAQADSGKPTWPAFPGERPAKQKLIAWLDAWEDDLNTAGFSAIMRGELPFECQKLKPRELLSVPADADPLRVALYAEKNAQIQFDNEIKKDECDARILECKNRLAAKLKKALRPSRHGSPRATCSKAAASSLVTARLAPPAAWTDPAPCWCILRPDYSASQALK